MRSCETSQRFVHSTARTMGNGVRVWRHISPWVALVIVMGLSIMFLLMQSSPGFAQGVGGHVPANAMDGASHAAGRANRDVGGGISGAMSGVGSIPLQPQYLAFIRWSVATVPTQPISYFAGFQAAVSSAIAFAGNLLLGIGGMIFLLMGMCLFFGMVLTSNLANIIGGLADEFYRLVYHSVQNVTLVLPFGDKNDGSGINMVALFTIILFLVGGTAAVKRMLGRGRSPKRKTLLISLLCFIMFTGLSVRSDANADKDLNTNWKDLEPMSMGWLVGQTGEVVDSITGSISNAVSAVSRGINDGARTSALKKGSTCQRYVDGMHTMYHTDPSTNKVANAKDPIVSTMIAYDDLFLNVYRAPVASTLYGTEAQVGRSTMNSWCMWADADPHIDVEEQYKIANAAGLFPKGIFNFKDEDVYLSKDKDSDKTSRAARTQYFKSPASMYRFAACDYGNNHAVGTLWGNGHGKNGGIVQLKSIKDRNILNDSGWKYATVALGRDKVNVSQDDGQPAGAQLQTGATLGGATPQAGPDHETVHKGMIPEEEKSGNAFARLGELGNITKICNPKYSYFENQKVKQDDGSFHWNPFYNSSHFDSLNNMNTGYITSAGSHPGNDLFSFIGKIPYIFGKDEPEESKHYSEWFNDAPQAQKYWDKANGVAGINIHVLLVALVMIVVGWIIAKVLLPLTLGLLVGTLVAGMASFFLPFALLFGILPSRRIHKKMKPLVLTIPIARLAQGLFGAIITLYFLSISVVSLMLTPIFDVGFVRKGMGSMGMESDIWRTVLATLLGLRVMEVLLKQILKIDTSSFRTVMNSAANLSLAPARQAMGKVKSYDAWRPGSATSPFRAMARAGKFAGKYAVAPSMAGAMAGRRAARAFTESPKGAAKSALGAMNRGFDKADKAMGNGVGKGLNASIRGAEKGANAIGDNAKKWWETTPIAPPIKRALGMDATSPMPAETGGGTTDPTTGKDKTKELESAKNTSKEAEGTTRSTDDTDKPKDSKVSDPKKTVDPKSVDSESGKPTDTKSAADKDAEFAENAAGKMNVPADEAREKMNSGTAGSAVVVKLTDSDLTSLTEKGQMPSGPVATKEAADGTAQQEVINSDRELGRIGQLVENVRQEIAKGVPVLHGDDADKALIGGAALGLTGREMKPNEMSASLISDMLAQGNEMLRETISGQGTAVRELIDGLTNHAPTQPIADDAAPVPTANVDATAVRGSAADLPAHMEMPTAEAIGATVAAAIAAQQMPLQERFDHLSSLMDTMNMQMANYQNSMREGMDALQQSTIAMDDSVQQMQRDFNARSDDMMHAGEQFNPETQEYEPRNDTANTDIRDLADAIRQGNESQAAQMGQLRDQMVANAQRQHDDMMSMGAAQMDSLSRTLDAVQQEMDRTISSSNDDMARMFTDTVNANHAEDMRSREQLGDSLDQGFSTMDSIRSGGGSDDLDWFD